MQRELAVKLPLPWTNSKGMDEVILHGGGEHARVVLDCLLASGCTVPGLFDPKYDGFLMGVPQRGAYNPQLEKQAKAIVAIGDNALRKEAALKTQHAFANAIHRSAIISKYSTIGAGCMILHGAIIQLPAGGVAYIFVHHLPPNPYQPYDIRDGNLTTAVAA